MLMLRFHLGVLGLLAIRAAATTVSVDVPGLGRVTGTDAGSYRVFLDIPFGLTTAGQYRWAPPRPVESYKNGTLDATVFRDGCAGANTGGDPVGPDAQSYSEDCLNLRIWTPPPNGDVDALRPVAVWLHGGGFMFGTTGDAMYDGRAYARDQGVVLVSLNYRLGALGFLATPNQGGDAKYDLSGNYGLLDQQLGLRWVQKHISAFGGDPNKVLLFGQSAGAMSIVCHLTAPASRGLFHAAEIRSPVGLHYQDAVEAKAHASTLATALGCFPLGEGIVPCLRKKSSADIVSKQLAPEYIRHLTDPGHGINWLEWVPTVDGAVLPGEPHDVIVNNGSWNRVPLIIGSMRNETNAWLPTALENESLAKLVFDSVMAINWGKGSSDKVAAAYGHAKGLSWFEMVGLASTDWLMSCYCRRLARAAAKQGVPTFLYQFLHPNSNGADPTNAMQPAPSHPACVDGRAACHAGDNMYTMGSVDLIPNANFTIFEANLSSLIMATTSRLAGSIGGSPATVAKAVLPLVPYDGVRSLAWGGVFDEESGREVLHSVVETWRGDVCEFWDTMSPVFPV
jgi:para-nitrobenzyl esterase